MKNEPEEGYSVEITQDVIDAITQNVRRIALEENAPENAQRWLNAIFDAVDSLEAWPRAVAKAEEDAFRPYEIRQKVIGKYLLLFTIDDESKQVTVIGFRHGYRLPRPDDLPRDE